MTVGKRLTRLTEKHLYTPPKSNHRCCQVGCLKNLNLTILSSAKSIKLYVRILGFRIKNRIFRYVCDKLLCLYNAWLNELCSDR